MPYDEEYYRSGNYTDYLDRRERYHRLARDIDIFLDSICLRKTGESVVDFGCGVGFLVEGFQKLSYTDVWGYDISTWAVKYGRDILGRVNGNKITTKFDDLPRRIHLTIMLDVLEHIEWTQIDKLLRRLRSQYILVRIPVSNYDDGEFIYPVSRKDPSHITAFSKNRWWQVFRGAGYTELCHINLPNIWDSKGVLCALYKCTS